MAEVTPLKVLVVDWDAQATPDSPLEHDHPNALNPFHFELDLGPGEERPVFPASASGIARIYDPDGRYDPAQLSGDARARVTGAKPAFWYVADKELVDWSLRWSGLVVFNNWANDVTTLSLHGLESFFVQQDTLFLRFNTDEPISVKEDTTTVGFESLTWTFDLEGRCAASAGLAEPESLTGDVVFSLAVGNSNVYNRVGSAAVDVASTLFGPIQEGTPHRLRATLTDYPSAVIERVIKWVRIGGAGDDDDVEDPPEVEDPTPDPDKPVTSTPVVGPTPVTTPPVAPVPAPEPLPTAQPDLQVVSLFVSQTGTTQVGVTGRIANQGGGSPSLNGKSVEIQYKVTTVGQWVTVSGQSIRTNTRGAFRAGILRLGAGQSYQARARTDGGRWFTMTFSTRKQAPVASGGVIEAVNATVFGGNSVAIVAAHGLLGFGAATRTYGRYRRKIGRSNSAWTNVAVQNPGTDRQSEWSVTRLRYGTTYEFQASHIGDFSQAKTAVFRTKPVTVPPRVLLARLKNVSGTSAELTVGVGHSVRAVTVTVKLVPRGFNPIDTQRNTKTFKISTVANVLIGVFGSLKLTGLRRRTTYDFFCTVDGSSAPAYTSSFSTRR